MGEAKTERLRKKRQNENKLHNEYNINITNYLCYTMSFFIHVKNQELLWSIIHQTPQFNLVFKNSKNNEPELWFRGHIQQYFQKIQYSQLSPQELNDCNREIITTMVNQLKMFIENMYTPKVQEPIPQNTALNGVNLPFTMDKKQDSYQQSLTERQKEYEQMNSKYTPPPANFSDGKDEVITNMDELILQHKLQREAELTQFAPVSVMPPSANSRLNEPLKLASNENITLTPDVVVDIPENKPKKVSWSTDKQPPEYLELVKEMNDLKACVLNMNSTFTAFQYEIRQLFTQIAVKRDDDVEVGHSSTHLPETVSDDSGDTI